MQYAVIIAGGMGQRLWPLSRRNKPKQIIDLFGNQSLLQICVDRIKPLFDPARILVITNAEYAEIVRKHLPDLPPENVLGEPIGRNTANAIGLAAAVLLRRDPEAVMGVFSADQLIEPVQPLHEAFRKAFAFLGHFPETLFTFGIKATFAHTGLGYLKRGEQSEIAGIYRVDAFKEKPNKSTAGKYIRSGDFCWNSGIFAWRADAIMRYLEQYLPHNADRLSRMGKAWDTPQWQETLVREFPQLEGISIDYGVMEKAPEVFMCELDCHWIDVGSFPALAETIAQQDNDHNSTYGSGVFLDSVNTIVLCDTPGHLVAAVGVEDLIIVHSGNATLICHRDDADNIRNLLDHLRGKGLEAYL